MSETLITRTSEFPSDVIIRSRRRSWDRWILLSLCLSVIAHLGFLYASISWKVADVSQVERSVETLFKVQLTKLESRNFLSRPTSVQLQQERERLLRQEMESLNSLTSQSMQPDVDLSAPTPSRDALPAWEDEESEDVFRQDQTANQLISSDFSRRTVNDFEKEAGREAIRDEITANRIPLTGRGSGAQGRLIAGLPKPALRDDPVVSRSITMVLDQHLPPPSPDLEISEPPIELPPVTELLPTPDLLDPNPAPVDLQSVEEARQEMKDRFVNLDDLLRVDLQTYHHIGGDGYFMIRIRPTAADERLRVLPKDVVFVVDASASMGRRRMGVILEELEKLIYRLRPQDRFNVVGFKQRVRKFTDALAPVTEDNREAAKRFIRPLEASGKTDIYTSLEPLVQLGTERARPLTLFLVSDGRPTVGVVNSRKIINNLTRHQGPSTSIFCLGSGDRINRYLLDMLAFRNRGLVAFEQDRSDLPPVIQSLYRYIEDPILLQTSADFLGVDETEVYPKHLPHLYLRGEIRIWGRLQDEKKFTFRLVGEAFDEQKEIVLDLTVPEHDNGTYEIARQWAFHKIYHIVGRMVDEGERPEFLEQIRFLSRTYRIVTPYSEQFE
ncbi:MAG: VWA domain-containing protein [Candidatus Omnitrophica bacterium]|nr:VWA domain-containing protein [Candidatus Omnitrophota bacterium]